SPHSATQEFGAPTRVAAKASSREYFASRKDIPGADSQESSGFRRARLPPALAPRASSSRRTTAWRFEVRPQSSIARTSRRRASARQFFPAILASAGLQRS